MTESFDEPEAIVVVDELGDDDSSFFDGLEAVDVKDLLLECPVEAFDDAVALRTPDEGRRVGKPQELEFSLEIV